MVERARPAQESASELAQARDDWAQDDWAALPVGGSPVGPEWAPEPVLPQVEAVQGDWVAPRVADSRGAPEAEWVQDDSLAESAADDWVPALADSVVPALARGDSALADLPVERAAPGVLERSLEDGRWSASPSWLEALLLPLDALQRVVAWPPTGFLPRARRDARPRLAAVWRRELAPAEEFSSPPLVAPRLPPAAR